MTRKARNTYRKHRKWTWFAALGVLVLAALAAVPAFAINTGNGNTPPAIPNSGSEAGVYSSLVNVGGSNFACSAAGDDSYGAGQGDPSVLQTQISKPQTGLTWSPSPGITLTIVSATKDKFAFKITGGKVLHVGVNGGTNTSWYDYINNGYPNGFGYPDGLGEGKNEDRNLRATPKSATVWYVTSITTFCYVPNNWVKPTCTTPFEPNDGTTSGGVEYSAQLQPKSGTPCKEQRVVMETGAGYANLHPTGTGDDWAVVERIAWMGSGTSPAVVIHYNDKPPYNDSNLRLMRLCDSDPRPDDDDYELLEGVTPELPSEAGVPHTSCILKVTVSAGADTSSRKYVAWIFSTVDGYRDLG